MVAVYLFRISCSKSVSAGVHVQVFTMCSGQCQSYKELSSGLNIKRLKIVSYVPVKEEPLENEMGRVGAIRAGELGGARSSVLYVPSLVLYISFLRVL